MAHTNSNGSGSYSNLDWALAYQRSGLVLLPLWPGIKMHHTSKKHPDRALLGAGFKMAEVGECTEEWVQRCWGGDYNTNGIGIVCGSRSQLLIVDIDVKNQGEWAWESWRAEREGEGKILPESPLVRTPSGGYHLWFRLPAGRVVRLQDGWLPGVDIAGDGKWVAAPPTFIRDKGKAYEFIRSGQTPEAPDWFLEEVEVRNRSHRPAWANAGGGVGGAEERFNWVAALSGPIQPGDQQVTLFRAAASARARGWDDEKALAKLRRVRRNFIEDPTREEWTDEHVVEAWDRVKREYADGDGVEDQLDEEDIPEYTPWLAADEPEIDEPVVEVDVTGVEERPRLRVIQGEGLGVEDEVSTGEAPTGGDGEVGGAGGAGFGLPPGGGWETPPSLGNTDEEHAREFHRLYGQQVLWVPGLEWHAWTGTHWRPDDAHDVNNLLTHLGYRIEAYRNVLQEQDGDFEAEVTALGRRIDKLWNKRSVDGVKAKAEPYAQIWNGGNLAPTDLDAHGDVFNTPIGTVKHRDGVICLEEHRQADLITRCTSVGYNPDARSDLLDRYRRTFMPEDEHWEALWRLVGSCLIGGNAFRQLILFVGPSTTGKSLLMQMIMKTLGSYASLGMPSLLRGNIDERPRADLMNVMNSRVVFIEEVGANVPLHADRVKDVTGGGLVTARKLHSNHYVTKKIEFTVIGVTNKPPRIKDADPALLRRIKVVPFDRTVIDHEDVAVRELMLNDEATLEAILAECIAGMRRAEAQGVDELPLRFEEARAAAYGQLTGGDDIGDFMSFLIDQKILVEENTKRQCVMTAELLELYVNSPGRRHDRNTREMTTTQFGDVLRMMGYTVKPVNGSRIIGWKLSQGLAVAKGWLDIGIKVGE